MAAWTKMYVIEMAVAATARLFTGCAPPSELGAKLPQAEARAPAPPPWPAPAFAVARTDLGG